MITHILLLLVTESTGKQPTISLTRRVSQQTDTHTFPRHVCMRTLRMCCNLCIIFVYWVLEHVQPVPSRLHLTIAFVLPLTQQTTRSAIVANAVQGQAVL